MPGKWALIVVLWLGGVALGQSPSSYNARPIAASTAPRPLPPALVLPAAPTALPAGGVRPVRFQAPMKDEEKSPLKAQVTPPSLERLSRLDSDEKLFERLRQEAKDGGSEEEVVFPPSPILSRERYLGRKGLWQQRQLVVEPGFVCYGKLFFEDKNAERYGWELGYLQVALSPAKFLADVALFPLKFGADPCFPKDCSSGHCLPGDPVPFLIYPPEITPSGTALEIGAILALVAIFP